MNILLNTIFLWDLWFLRYRECPYSDTVRIRLLSPIWLQLRVTIFQGIYGNQTYIEEAIPLNSTLRNLFI